MDRSVVAFLFTIFAIFGAGTGYCAAGDTADSKPRWVDLPIQTGNGRLVVYRNHGGWFATPLPTDHYKPAIFVDAQRVGVPVAGTVFFIDVPSGVHTIVCDGRQAHLTVAAGDKRYVSIEVSEALDRGFPLVDRANFRPVLIDPEQAEEDLSKLKYVEVNPMPSRGPVAKLNTVAR